MSDTESRRPKVSVAMITYNHERFIEQAVRSVMMQETDFDYELIIGEDCSTDRTREVVLQLKEEFPDKVRLLLHPQNIGMIPNLVAVYNACDGDYIALLEGDDYWTDPKKLQIQVDYMEAHPECRICFHDFSTEYVDSEVKLQRRAKLENEYQIGVKQLLNRNDIATCTAILKRSSEQIPAWYNGLRAAGDWPLYLASLLSGGYATYLDWNMAVYRVHPTGATYVLKEKLAQTSRALEYRLSELRDLEIIEEILPWRLRKETKPRRFATLIDIVRLHVHLGNNELARLYIRQTILAIPMSRNNIKKIIKLITQIYIDPRLTSRLRRSARIR